MNPDGQRYPRQAEHRRKTLAQYGLDLSHRSQAALLDQLPRRLGFGLGLGGGLCLNRPLFLGGALRGGRRRPCWRVQPGRGGSTLRGRQDQLSTGRRKGGVSVLMISSSWLRVSLPPP